MLTTAEMELEEILDKAGPEMRDIAQAIYNVGVEAERKRIKQELLDDILGNCARHEKGEAVIHERLLRKSLDKVCPT